MGNGGVTRACAVGPPLRVRAFMVRPWRNSGGTSPRDPSVGSGLEKLRVAEPWATLRVVDAGA